jgi:hypothetical protein
MKQDMSTPSSEKMMHKITKEIIAGINNSAITLVKFILESILATRMKLILSVTGMNIVIHSLRMLRH